MATGTSAFFGRGQWVWCAAVVLLAGGIGACSQEQRRGGDQRQAARSPEGSAGGTRPEPPKALTEAEANRMQTELMDLVDDMTLQLAEAVDEIERTPQTIEARTVAHRLKYSVAHGATLIAMSKNPRVAMVDLMVMTTLQSELMTRHIAPEYFGPEADKLAGVFASTAQRSRQVVERDLSPEIMAVLDRLIERWLEEHPQRVFAGYVRLSQFARFRQMTAEPEKSGGASNVLGLLFLDPLSGLDPATREIEKARLTAERAMYYMQRMPTLVSWQAELLYLDTVNEPESQQLIRNSQTLTDSAARITQETEALRQELPEIIAREREAMMDRASQIVGQQRQEAIDQAFANLARERSATIEALAAQEQRLGPMIGDLREAVEAGTALSESLGETTATFSRLMTQMGVDQEGDRPESEDDGESFDINSYTQALREATTTAQELTRLTESLMDATDPAVLDSRLGLVDDRIDRVEGTMDRLLGRLLWIGLVLVGAATVGGIVVVVLWSRVRRRGQITVSSARVELAGEQYDGR